MSKASNFWNALPTVQHLKRTKVDILNDCTDIICFVNPMCPDSQNLSEKLTKFCIYHNNKIPQYNLQLHLVDVDGVLAGENEGKNGQLLLYSRNGFEIDTNDNLEENIFPMWDKYGNKTVDSAFSDNGQPYFIPQLVLWHNDTNKIKGAWYQHHYQNEHALRLTCGDVNCKYCLNI